MAFSFLIGAFAVFLSSRAPGVSSTLLFSLVILIFFIVVFLLLFSGLQKVFPGEGNRRFLFWLVALGAAGVLTLLLFPPLSGFLSTYGPVPTSGTTGSFRVYEDPALGFRIAYPVTWAQIRRKSQGSDIVTNTAFVSRDGKTVATVQVTDLSLPGYLGLPLDIWTNHTIGVLSSNNLSSGFTLLRNERTVFSGYPAQLLDYTVVLYSGDRVRTVGYLLQAGSKGYNIGFTSREDLFDVMAATREQVLSSFTITG